MLPSIDMRKTVMNMILAASTDAPAAATTGMTHDQMMGCARWYFSSGQGGSDFSYLGDAISRDCPTMTATDCSDMFSLYGGSTKAGFNRDRVSGSLLGITNFLTGVGYNEPVPVNLAYFWNDSIKSIPFASSALAADVRYGNAPFITFVLGFWKVTRNLAYGMLSIVMLVVGVSIMMRKKLPPQLVVTAQYALPRIVLAVILITFSYPIGALLASSTKFLLALTNGLIYDVMQSTGITSLTVVLGGGISAVVLLIITLILSIWGAGFVALIVTGILLFAAVLLYGLIWLRAMMLYIKLIISIIFAPFAFVLGAIPGNEANTSKWFRSAISNVLGYVLSVAYAHMVIALLLIAVHNGFSAEGIGAGATVGGILVAAFFPVFLVYGFIQAIKVPAKINAVIMGEDGKSRGRR